MRAGALVACCAALLAGPVLADGVVAAQYSEPTTRYDHGILGDAVEWAALEIETAGGQRLIFRLPESRVFEDTEPRVADVTGDGEAEVVVVETDLDLGARLAVYGAGGLIAATGYIGQTHRWLAPVGIADFNGDGRAEIAYVDRPHLAKILRIVGVDGGRLVELAAAPGLTNHRIGENRIGGAVRDCGQGPEIVTADADWRRVMVSRLGPGGIVSEDAGPFVNWDSATACP